MKTIKTMPSNNNEDGFSLLKTIITLAICAIIVLSFGFIYYIFLAPEDIEIVEKDPYIPIDASYYNVNENELNGEWISTFGYSFDADDLRKYEDLRDYYQGRYNPFATFGDTNNSREDIIDVTLDGDYSDNPNNDDYEDDLPTDITSEFIIEN